MWSLCLTWEKKTYVWTNKSSTVQLKSRLLTRIKGHSHLSYAFLNSHLERESWEDLAVQSNTLPQANLTWQEHLWRNKMYVRREHVRLSPWLWLNVSEHRTVLAPGLPRDLFVFGRCYHRILTSFRFRLNLLTPVLHRIQKNLTCWAWLLSGKSKSMKIRNPFLLGIVGGTDLHACHCTERNGGSSGMIEPSELPLVCTCASSCMHPLGLNLDLRLEMDI